MNHVSTFFVYFLILMIFFLYFLLSDLLHWTKAPKQKMKKSAFAKIRSWLMDVVPKGIAVFAIAAGSYYVFAAVTYPGTPPGTITGLVGQYVGVSSSQSNGAVANGYEGANVFCSGTFSGSHVCTAMEMINTYNNDPGAIPSSTAQVWINNGPPGHDLTLANDCKGWSFNQASEGGNNRFGSVWNFSSNSAKILSCNQSVAFACCK